MKTRASTRGFTLIEMIVAIALFAVVMLVGVGALLSLVSANRKAQALQAVMNNLNITIDGMVRAVRMGSIYNCGSSASVPTNCPAGATYVSFLPYGANPQNQSERWVYHFVAPVGATSGYIERSEKGGQAGTYVRLTSPEVSISDVNFYVIGAGTDSANQYLQPLMIIEIKGTAGVGSQKVTSSFHVQATAVQRAIDI